MRRLESAAGFPSAAAWGSPAGWATAAFATAASIVSLWAFEAARRSERKRLFVALDERLTGPDA
ncbi:hypothetical protein [Agromyces arachidis]|uniref:hypothetical protein n=1 Tax=Agromyces arachidis TaxID=766966 RepID=UPI004055D4D5